MVVQVLSLYLLASPHCCCLRIHPETGQSHPGSAKILLLCLTTLHDTWRMQTGMSMDEKQAKNRRLLRTSSKVCRPHPSMGVSGMWPQGQNRADRGGGMVDQHSAESTRHPWTKRLCSWASCLEFSRPKIFWVQQETDLASLICHSSPPAQS